MKKLLLLLAGLLFAVLPSKAQDKIAEITSTVVTNIEDLTTGYYIINCYIPRTKGDVDNNSPEKPWGSLYYNPNRLDRPFDVTSDGFIFEGQSQVNSEQSAYIWLVNKDESGILKIQNVSKEVYIPVDPDRNRNMNMTSAKDAATLKGINKTFTDVLEREMSGIVLQYTNESVANAPWTIYANYESPKDPNLSYWTTGEGEVMFQFVKLQNIDFSFKYPFKSSIAPTAEGFHPETRWQLLTIKNQYLYYTDDNTNIKVTASPSYEDKYWWAFSINEDGSFAIYNKAAGPTKVLAAGAMSGDNGGSTFPRFVASDNVPEGQIARWNYLQSTHYTDKNGFYIYRGDAQNEKMNLRGDLSFWSSNQDDGSTFWISAASDEVAKYAQFPTYQATAKELQAVGTLKDEVAEQITTLLATPNPENLRSVQELFNNKENQAVALNTASYYYIMTPGRSEKNYMTMTSDTLIGTNYNKKNAALIWKFTGDATSGYTLASQGRYAQKPRGTSQKTPTTSEQESASLFKLNKFTDVKVGLWSIKPENDGLHLDANYNIVGWTNGGGSEWYLIEAPSVDITISNVGYATVNYPFAVQLPEEGSISAYIGTVIENNNSTLLLKKISNGLIPANTPVVLEGVKGEEKTYTLTIVADDASTNPEENVLKGTLLPEAISEEAFILGVNEETVGFYKLNTEENTVGANKAYLPKSVLPKLPAGVKGVTFSFDDNSGETTGIEDATINLAEEEFYDLQGRRIMNPTKGIYVTKSGKKVLFTK